MKYTPEQQEIVSLCRKYRNVKVEFKDAKTAVINSNEFVFYFGIAEIEQWLNGNAVLKSKSAPRQRKPAEAEETRQGERYIGLTERQWAKMNAYAKELGITKTALISGMVDNLQTLLPNTCKYCAYENSCSYASPTHGECSDCVKKQGL